MIKLILITILVLTSIVTNAQVKKDSTFKHYPKSQTIKYNRVGHIKSFKKDSGIISQSDINDLSAISPNSSKVITRHLKDGSTLTINSINREGKITMAGSISTTTGDSAVEILIDDKKNLIMNKKHSNSVKFIKAN